MHGCKHLAQGSSRDMVEHWEYGIGFLVWFNILGWLVFGALKEKANGGV